MTLVASLRARLDAPRTRARAAEYDVSPTRSSREAAQLELVNECWARTCATVPFWEERTRDHGLPTSFASLDEFTSLVPTTNRSDFQAARDRLTSSEGRPEFMRITGGSTAEPVQIPSWKSELDFTKLDMWLARGWYGIGPESRLFLHWGHSHLLGSGWRGWVNARKREISDRLLGYCRFSAYDLSPEALRRAADALIRFRPDFVIGYSVALDLFRAVNEDRRAELRSAGVRLVLAAAEGFPAPDSAERLSELFGCPVGMEYGAVETGLVAHTHPEGGYRVFWRSYLVDVERAGDRHALRVTSLYPRCTPLIRYELGDEIELPEGAPDRIASVHDFERVLGRCNDFVQLDDGFTAHSEVFTHAVRACAAIRSFQVVHDSSGLRLLYLASQVIDSGEQEGIRDRLGRVHPDLGRIPIEHVSELVRTVAGKTPMILRR